MIKLEIFLAKIPGKGEDAHPIAESFPDGSGLVAVFDGMGGAGSTKYEIEGTQFSGAWFASRLTKSLFAAFFRAKKGAGEQIDLPKLAAEFSASLKEKMTSAINLLDVNPSKLRSSLIRRLPTTLSAVYFEPASAGNYQAWALNAGDSRSYLLKPETGLQQITLDDVRNPGNALENLFGDSKISNCLHADAVSKLRISPLETQSPVIFLSASDGCFDYIPFPAEFEYFLLDTLQQASNETEWQALLAPKFKQIASDDVTLGLIALGWPDFEALKAAFARRKQIVEENYHLPIRKMNERLSKAEEDRETLLKEREKLRNECWNAYAVQYEALFPAKITQDQV